MVKDGGRCGKEGERAIVWGLSLYVCLKSLKIPGRGQAETMCRAVKGHLKSRSILIFWLLVLIC